VLADARPAVLLALASSAVVLADARAAALLAPASYVVVLADTRAATLLALPSWRLCTLPFELENLFFSYWRHLLG